MSKEAISRVLAAEAEANAIRERARAEARDRVSACEQDSAARAANTVAETAASLKTRMETVRRRADALILRSREEASADIQAMRIAAEAKMREAVKHIEWEFCDI